MNSRESSALSEFIALIIGVYILRPLFLMLCWHYSIQEMFNVPLSFWHAFFINIGVAIMTYHTRPKEKKPQTGLTSKSVEHQEVLES